MHTQERALLSVQRGEGLAERLFYLATVSFRKIAELGVDHRRCLGSQIRETLSAAAAEVNGSAYGEYTNPASEWPAARILLDLERSSDKQLLAQGLADIIHERIVWPVTRQVPSYRA
jgi:hypothetical protein